MRCRVARVKKCFEFLYSVSFLISVLSIVAHAPSSFARVVLSITLPIAGIVFLPLFIAEALTFSVFWVVANLLPLPVAFSRFLTWLRRTELLISITGKKKCSAVQARDFFHEFTSCRYNSEKRGDGRKYCYKIMKGKKI